MSTMNASFGRRRDDVGEVLLGTDAEVDAAGRQHRLEVRDDGLKRVLVGEKVVGSKRAAGLGELGDQLPERLVAQSRRQTLARRRARPAPTATRSTLAASVRIAINNSAPSESSSSPVHRGKGYVHRRDRRGPQRAKSPGLLRRSRRAPRSGVASFHSCSRSRFAIRPPGMPHILLAASTSPEKGFVQEARTRRAGTIIHKPCG